MDTTLTRDSDGYNPHSRYTTLTRWIQPSLAIAMDTTLTRDSDGYNPHSR